MTADKHLKQVLPLHPKFTYRRTSTLLDKIPRNIVDPPPKKPTVISNFSQGKFFSHVSKCYACIKTKKKNIKRNKFTASATGKEYQMKD